MFGLAGIATVLGRTLIVVGLLITGFGVYSVLKLDNFYSRSVVTSKVEAMGFFTVTVGAMFLSGASVATLKLLVLLVFELLTVSAGAHAVARSAWISGYRTRTVTPPEEPDADSVLQGGITPETDPLNENYQDSPAGGRDSHG
jgi:multicomponent Na+:H+ antiporter subunit G